MHHQQDLANPQQCAPRRSFGMARPKPQAMISRAKTKRKKESIGMLKTSRLMLRPFAERDKQTCKRFIASPTCALAP